MNVSSSAAKGESRGVIEDKTRFLERERGFLFWGLVSWTDGKKQYLTTNIRILILFIRMEVNVVLSQNMLIKSQPIRFLIKFYGVQAGQQHAYVMGLKSRGERWPKY
jgi:hypothetical protein